MLKLTVNQKAISMVVSKDIYRPSMQGVYFDHETKELVVTDGHILAIIPVEVPEAGQLDLESYVLPVAAFPKKQGNFTTVCREGKKLTVTEIDKKKSIIETRIVNVLDEPYPNYKAVLPWAGETPAQPMQLDKIGLNVELLAAFAAIARSLGKLPDFKFTFYGERQAARLDNAGFTGLIMPVRID